LNIGNFDRKLLNNLDAELLGPLGSGLMIGSLFRMLSEGLELDVSF